MNEDHPALHCIVSNEEIGNICAQDVYKSGRNKVKVILAFLC